MEGYLPYLLKPTEVKQAPVIPEKEEKKEVRCLESASKELSARLKNTLERQGIHPRYIDEAKIYVPIGSDINPDIGIDELIKQTETETTALYKGGIGTGIKGNTSENIDPKSVSSNRIAAVYKDKKGVNEKILKKMRKTELTGSSVNFLARANYGIIIDIVPPDDDGIEHLSSLRADASLLTELMASLRTKERQKKPDLFFFSNGGYKFFQYMLSGFIKTSEDLQRTNEKNIQDKIEKDHAATEKELLLEVKRSKWFRLTGNDATRREEEVVDPWESGYDFVNFLESINGCGVFMSGAPEGIDSITFPFNPADKNIVTRLIKLGGVQAMRLAVKAIGRASLSAPIDALLTKNLLPHDTALLASRLFEMANFTTRDLEMMDQKIINETKKMVGQFCQDMSIEYVVNMPDLDVVDSSASLVAQILAQILSDKVGIVEIDTSVMYEGDADPVESPHTSAIKNKDDGILILKTISQMRRLGIIESEAPEAGSHQILTSRYSPRELVPTGIDKFGLKHRRPLRLNINKLKQVYLYPEDDIEKEISNLFRTRALASTEHTNTSNPFGRLTEEFFEKIIPFLKEDSSDLGSLVIDQK